MVSKEVSKQWKLSIIIYLPIYLSIHPSIHPYIEVKLIIHIDIYIYIRICVCVLYTVYPSSRCSLGPNLLGRLDQIPAGPGIDIS